MVRESLEELESNSKIKETDTQSDLALLHGSKDAQSLEHAKIGVYPSLICWNFTGFSRHRYATLLA